jgi:hypothetical protein
VLAFFYLFFRLVCRLVIYKAELYATLNWADSLVLSK